jgi:biotin carboxyl carrier protein
VRYFVSLDPAVSEPPTHVDVVELPSGQLDVKIGQKPVKVDVIAVGDRLNVIVDGRVVDLTVEGAPPEVGVIASGRRAYVRVESERMRSAEQAKRTKSGDGEKLLRSPMPGRVVRVLVAKGDAVAAGQPVVVVEAMKMENEVRAKAAATVVDVHVSIGDTVEGNAKLVTLG